MMCCDDLNISLLNLRIKFEAKQNINTEDKRIKIEKEF